MISLPKPIDINSVALDLACCTDSMSTRTYRRRRFETQMTNTPNVQVALSYVRYFDSLHILILVHNLDDNIGETDAERLCNNVSTLSM